jgi:hypothetical protein
MSKKRTITLSGRRPVTISDDAWELIAEAEEDSYSSRDFSRYRQAKAQGELDEWTLRVRQHADGRAVVYGILSAATAWTGSKDWRGGELVPPGGDLAAAIERVGRDGGFPPSVIRACVANLPAEDL